MSAGTVYVIQAGAYFKIGRTTDLTQRMDGLRTGSPAPLTVIYRLDTRDSEGFERWLHRRFAEVRVQGEWYRLTDEQLAETCAIQVWPRRRLTEPEQLPLRFRMSSRPAVRLKVPSPVPVATGSMTLRQLLRQRGITRSGELAQRVGISRQQAYLLWQGKRLPSRDMIHRLSEATGIAPEVLFLADRPAPQPQPRGRPRKRRQREP